MAMYPWADWPYTNVHQLNLDWVVEKLRQTIEFLKEKAAQIDKNSADIQVMQQKVDALEKLIKLIQEGGFDDLYLSAVQEWLNANLPGLVHNLVKYVVFGLTLDGYFCAVIPDAWNFIWFDTIADAASDLYGHLVLHW